MREKRIRKAVIFSAAMAQYVERLPDLHVVLDLVDVDSAKWTQYAERHSWPFSFIYRREGVKLLAVERSAAAQAAATVLVTRGEAELFQRLAPECNGRVHVIENGVDVEYFAPHDDLPSPYARRRRYRLSSPARWITGRTSMRCRGSRVRSCREWRSSGSDARFYIVGMDPATTVSGARDRTRA